MASQNIVQVWRRLGNIADKLIARVNSPDTVRAVRITMNRMRLAVTLMAVWPLALLLVAMIGYQVAQWAIPIITIIAGMTLLQALLRPWPLTTIAVAGAVGFFAPKEDEETPNPFKEFAGAVKDLAAALRMIAVFEIVGVCAYCSLVPVTNDVRFGLLVYIFTVGIVCLIGIQNTAAKTMVAILTVGIAIFTLILCFGGRTGVGDHWQKLQKEAAEENFPRLPKPDAGKAVASGANNPLTTTAAAQITYTERICDDADVVSYANKDLTDVNNRIDVPLGEACYGNYIILPQIWDQFRAQLTMDGSDYVSVWCNGSAKPLPPITVNQQGLLESELSQCYVRGKGGMAGQQTLEFQLRGKGRVTIIGKTFRPAERVDENGYLRYNNG